jgi:hypothetical protein
MQNKLPMQIAALLSRRPSFKRPEAMRVSMMRGLAEATSSGLLSTLWR